MIGVVIGIILFLAFAGCIVFSVIKLKSKKASNNVDGKGNKGIKKYIGFIGAGVSFLLFLFIPFSIHTVNPGEVAVVKHLGEAVDTRAPGTYMDFWFTNSYVVYDSKVQNLEVNTGAYSKDAQTMDIAMTVQYQIKVSEAVQIANHYGSLSVLENRISSVATEKTKSALSKYSAMEIIENRAKISPEVANAIKDAIDENYFVDIVAVVLTDIDFSDAFEQTVENKMIAEQEKLKAQYEKDTAIINAEKELEVAKKQAEAKLEQAKADAEAKVAIAEAEAKATKLKSIEVARALGFKIEEKEITDDDGNVTGNDYFINFEGKSADEIKVITDYMKYIEYLNSWDGKLPETLVTDKDGASIFIPTT